jgi:hypothetical protein
VISQGERQWVGEIDAKSFARHGRE